MPFWVINLSNIDNHLSLIKMGIGRGNLARRRRRYRRRRYQTKSLAVQLGYRLSA
jgi:hypothetical protein